MGPWFSTFFPQNFFLETVYHFYTLNNFNDKFLVYATNKVYSLYDVCYMYVKYCHQYCHQYCCQDCQKEHISYTYDYLF